MECMNKTLLIVLDMKKGFRFCIEFRLKSLTGWGYNIPLPGYNLELIISHVKI